MPKPRQAEGLEVTESGDGFVVYDPGRDRVHYLNHTAALVLEFCTGANDTEQIVAMVQACYDLSEPPEEPVAECLRTFATEGLVE